MAEPTVYQKLLNQIHYDLKFNKQAVCMLEEFTRGVAKTINDMSLGDLNNEDVRITLYNITPLVNTKALELTKHAMAEGTKAVSKYKQNGNIPDAFAIQFTNLVRNRFVTDERLIFLAAVVEYLLAEIIEVAGHKANDDDTRTITGSHIIRAFDDDEELKVLLEHNEINLDKCGTVVKGKKKPVTKKNVDVDIDYTALLNYTMTKYDRRRKLTFDQTAICRLNQFSNGFINAINNLEDETIYSIDMKKIVMELYPPYQYLGEQVHMQGMKVLDDSDQDSLITIFPVEFREHLKASVTIETAIFVASILETLLTNILELSYNSAVERDSKTIDAFDIDRVIEYDQEITEFIQHNKIKLTDCKNKVNKEKKVVVKKTTKKIEEKKPSPKVPKKKPAEVVQTVPNSRRKKEIVYLDLKSDLNLNTKEALQKAAGKLGMTGYSKLNKGPLIAMMQDYIDDPESMMDVRYKK